MRQTPLVGEHWIRVSVDVTGPYPRSVQSVRFECGGSFFKVCFCDTSQMS